MFYYRNYRNCAKATLVNASVRMLGFFPCICVFFDVYYNGDPNYFVVSVSVVFLIAMWILSNKLSDKIALEAEEKHQEKRQELVDTNTYVQGADDDEILTTPATIVLKRDNCLMGFAVAFKFSLNDSETHSLRVGKSVTLKTDKKLNVIKASGMEDEEKRVVKFTVENGENIEIIYKGCVFHSLNR
ncbi:MAG: hypothetical protein R3Y12_09035 [Clostridia bacterium]